ncbi:MAG: hypothetical protein R2724_05080 [Bryobacterales bacterium]
MRLSALGLLALLASASAGAEGLIPMLRPDQAIEAATLVISSFQTNPRGPSSAFAGSAKTVRISRRIPYPCAERGGGVQHATLSAEAQKLAKWNIDVGTIYAGMTYGQFVDAPRDHHRLKELVLERYLEQVDAGWIYRRAYSYRGRAKSKTKRSTAVATWTKLFSDPNWLHARLFLANQLVDAVPHGAPDTSVRRIRALAQSIAEADERFQPIRAKIHSAPEPTKDLRAVRTVLP